MSISSMSAYCGRTGRNERSTRTLRRLLVLRAEAMTQSGLPILTVFDADTSCTDSGPVCLWNGYRHAVGCISLLAYCDQHAARLREKYCAWVHDLGQTVVGGKSVIDHLALEPGLSYWWMSLLVEQSSWKSPAIKDAIRMLALEELLVEQRPAGVKLVSANTILHETLDGMCCNLGIAYQWQRQPAPAAGSWMRRLFAALPHPVRALPSLLSQLRVHWPFRRAAEPVWFSGPQAVFFCSYFDNIDPEAAAREKFHSYYWDDLPGLLRKLGRQANWLQMFVRCAAVPDAATAMEMTRRTNRQRQDQGSHVFVDSFIAPGAALRVIRRWCGLLAAAWRLRHIRGAFVPSGSRLSLWPLMRNDWRASLCGSAAVGNLLWLELFDRAIGTLPHQALGFHLYENQAWERAMIHAWRKHGHGRMIAVPHSTRSFWDLRFYRDPRANAALPYPIPQADAIAANGRAALQAFSGENYPVSALRECEALRYGYLNNLRARAARPASGGVDPVKVLVLGDYLPSGTARMMNLLTAAATHLRVPARFTIKPHPNYLVDPASFPALAPDIVMQPLGEILHDYDVAFSGNLSSAAVDAYLAGVPVVVMLDDYELNLSPLRGHAGVCFVSSAGELADALQQAHAKPAADADSSDFFFLDPELPRWSHLLAN